MAPRVVSARLLRGVGGRRPLYVWPGAVTFQDRCPSIRVTGSLVFFKMYVFLKG